MTPFSKSPWVLLSALFWACTLSADDFSKHAEPLRSLRDIKRAPSQTDNIWIGELPLNCYSALVKFANLKHVSFHRKNGEGADDQRLQVLSGLGFTNLFDVGLLNCPRVTDRGIRALTNLPALRFLQLEGTAITDAGCSLLAGTSTVTGVNASYCTNVTRIGILALARSPTVRELGFSLDQIDKKEVPEIIDSMSSGSYCIIVDPKGELNSNELKQRGQTRGIQVVLQAQGALPGFLGERPRPWSSEREKGK